MHLFSRIRGWFTGQKVHHPSPQQGQPSAPDAVSANREAMARMHVEMDVPATGNPDLDFANTMIPHHQGAVEMAEVELKYGTDPDMRQLAGTIVDAQKKEIKFMREWRQRLRAEIPSDRVKG